MVDHKNYISWEYMRAWSCYIQLWSSCIVLLFGGPEVVVLVLLQPTVTSISNIHVGFKSNEPSLSLIILSFNYFSIWTIDDQNDNVRALIFPPSHSRSAHHQYYCIQIKLKLELSSYIYISWSVACMGYLIDLLSLFNGKNCWSG